MGANNYVTAAVSDDRRLLVALPARAAIVSVDFGSSMAIGSLSPSSTAHGKTLKTETQKEKKVRRIPSPPGEDLVLLVRASPGGTL